MFVYQMQQQRHRMILCSLLFACLISFVACIAPINKDVTRTIDATEAIIRVTIEIKTEQLDKGNPYSFLLPKNATKHLAYLSISRINKKNEKKELEIVSEAHERRVGNDVQSDEFVEYNVLAPIKDPVFTVQAVFTHMLIPLPREITQLEDQLVQFFDNHYVISVYRTISQKTIIKLPKSKSIESFTKLQPYSYRGSNLELGPYKQVNSYDSSPLTVHYVNNKPFAMFSEVCDVSSIYSYMAIYALVSL